MATRSDREAEARRRFVREFRVHPNRSEIDTDLPGHNGHYRSVARAPSANADRPRCVARVMLPPQMRHRGDPDGSVTFRASTWRSVVAGARSVAEDFGNSELLPPFGFKDRARGPGWFWWDGTRTEHNILETADAQAHVRRYLEGLFPGCGAIDLHAPQ